MVLPLEKFVRPAARKGGRAIVVVFAGAAVFPTEIGARPELALGG
jgi:hypothetical protein